MSLRPTYSVAIAGAGPAGAMVVKHVPAGVGALLIDARDKLAGSAREKLCGGMLTVQAQRLLPELPAEVRAEPFKTRIEYHDLDNRIFGRMPVGYANCRRGALDRWLLETALSETKARVEYKPRIRLLGVREADGLLRLKLDNGEATAECLIDCTGWRAVGRWALGISPAPHLNAVQASCRMAKSHPYYISVFHSATSPFFGWFIPKSEVEGEVGAAFAPEARGSGEELLQPFLEHLRNAGLALEPVRFQGCRLTHINSVRDIWLGGGRVLACGEAAGLVSPSSGDGISYALASGRAAALNLSGGTLDHAGYRRLLQAELAELRRNVVKAAILAHPLKRRLAAALLPLAHRGAYERLSL
jgi:flavin-dependent dehydrogenase